MIPSLTTPLYSNLPDLADAPDLADLVALFVDSMPAKEVEFTSLAERRRWDELAQAVHQLKGAGGSYGFPAVTQYAAQVSQTLQDGDPAVVHLALEELFDVCRRLNY